MAEEGSRGCSVEPGKQSQRAGPPKGAVFGGPMRAGTWEGGT